VGGIVYAAGAIDGSADNLLRDFDICEWQPYGIDSYLICIY